MSPVAFQCVPASYDDQPCLRLLGSARNTDADSLTARIDELSKQVTSVLYVDLSQTRLLDSAALGAIVFQHNRLRSEGKKLVALNPSPTCKHILQITALNRVLEIVDDETIVVGAPS